ncbi:hypothetical protein L249_2994 [Ophiocordyceps polyrhachis-furcata BCC 54312]|uniref:Uncharacterized protein n=1 Tax=Ophiocordyceps polyrhachis-furcata BCC 54312 TaxID=1330021 RepID=A0A367LNM4_9HYPO|nr:hypothetical protein L249_2994 [Ophiocordyceps polyrhachis-furcata BCC 54312]
MLTEEKCTERMMQEGAWYGDDDDDASRIAGDPRTYRQVVVPAPSKRGEACPGTRRVVEQYLPVSDTLFVALRTKEQEQIVPQHTEYTFKGLDGFRYLFVVCSLACVRYGLLLLLGRHVFPPFCADAPCVHLCAWRSTNTHLMSIMHACGINYRIRRTSFYATYVVQLFPTPPISY